MAKVDNASKLNELRAQVAELAKQQVTNLKKELDLHDAKFEDLRGQIEEVNDQINKLIEKRAVLADKIAKDHAPEHSRISNELRDAARDSGGKFMSDT
jgi:chorismate mutase